ncbi:unnamed protein product, partial [Polarella glacialis]
GVTELCIDVEIVDDDAFEDDEEFYIDLLDVQCNEVVGTCTVAIIDDDDPGSLSFVSLEVEVYEDLEDTEVLVEVQRSGGCTGAVGCTYVVESDGACSGVHYE